MGAARDVIRRDLPGSRFKRSRKSAGGRFSGVAADGGARMGRGIHGASENRSRVKRGRSLLPIVRVSGRALDVVDRAARRSGRRRRGDTGNFGVGFSVHCWSFPVELSAVLEKDFGIV